MKYSSRKYLAGMLVGRKDIWPCLWRLKIYLSDGRFPNNNIQSFDIHIDQHRWLDIATEYAYHVPDKGG